MCRSTQRGNEIDAHQCNAPAVRGTLLVQLVKNNGTKSDQEWSDAWACMASWARYSWICHIPLMILLLESGATSSSTRTGALLYQDCLGGGGEPTHPHIPATIPSKYNEGEAQ